MLLFAAGPQIAIVCLYFFAAKKTKTNYLMTRSFVC